MTDSGRDQKTHRQPSCLEEVGCPLCEVSDAIVFFREPPFVVNRCRRCGILYVSPRPAESEESYWVPHREHVEQLPPTTTYVESIIASRRLNMLKRFIQSGKVLEIGCAYGDWLAQASQYFDVAGMERDAACANYIRRKYRFQVWEKDDLSQVGLAPQSLDVIALFDVLSHLRNPVNTLQQAHALLKPGGFLFLITGNLADMTSRKAGASFEDRWCIPDHLHFFNEASLRQLLTRKLPFSIIHLSRELDLKSGPGSPHRMARVLAAVRRPLKRSPEVSSSPSPDISLDSLYSLASRPGMCALVRGYYRLYYSLVVFGGGRLLAPIFPHFASELNVIARVKAE